jgi:hypothetical protein
MSAVVSFLSGEAPDRRGRTVREILGMWDDELEEHHDYIQWLFPLTTHSAAVPGSPVLTEGDVAAIRADPRCIEHLRRARERMLQFYRDTRHWLRPSDHNHLRITRIIKSLHLVVGPEDAREFFEEVISLNAAAGAPVNEASLRYWRGALGGE